VPRPILASWLDADTPGSVRRRRKPPCPAEFEQRSAAGWLDGVTAGMDCSINGTAVDIAAGQAYVQGKLFTGASSVSFSAGDASGTYYVYIDPNDASSPYEKATTQPGAGYLVLCSVQWDGSALSNLVDLRPMGLVAACLRFNVSGAVSAGTIAYALIDRDFWIEDVQIMLASTGSAGSTIVDVHVGASGAAPASIFTDQTRRPQLDSTSADYSVAVSGIPDTNRLANAGYVVQVDVDQAATDAAGLAVLVRGRYV